MDILSIRTPTPTFISRCRSCPRHSGYTFPTTPLPGNRVAHGREHFTSLAGISSCLCGRGYYNQWLYVWPMLVARCLDCYRVNYVCSFDRIISCVLYSVPLTDACDGRISSGRNRRLL